MVKTRRRQDGVKAGRKTVWRRVKSATPRRVNQTTRALRRTHCTRMRGRGWHNPRLNDARLNDSRRLLHALDAMRDDARLLFEGAHPPKRGARLILMYTPKPRA